MTLNEAYLLLKKQLQLVYEPREAANIANWVLENLSGMTRSDRLMDIGIALPHDKITKLYSHIERLLQHEPVQYVLEECWFAEMKLFVNEHVLIPRPETEELVDWIFKDHQANKNNLSILDIGCGSGCIPIYLQKKIANAGVWTCDVSESALEVAKENAKQLDAEKIKFLQLDFLNEAERDQLPLFDIIVSNPPYIPVKDKAGMYANVLQFEPGLALFVPDNDSLVFYEAIASFGKEKLNKGGMVYVEIHENLGDEVVNLFKSKNYGNVELKKDFQGRDRMVKAVLDWQ